MHFELPGAAAEAKRLGESEQKPFADWVLEKYGEIPWWISVALPVATTMKSSQQAPITKSLFERILASIT